MLARLQRSIREKDPGFTLIELLVVIVIIGILAAIAIPLFLNQRKKGVDASMKSDVKSAATSVETWITDNPTSAVPAASPGTAPLLGFTASSGNTVKVKPGTALGSYCIDAVNPASSADASTTTKYAKYISGSGGLQSGSATGFYTACA